MFRTPFLLTVALLVSGGASAQPTRPVRAEVTAVTVFRDRAQVTATARTTVGAGSTEVIVGHLPTGLDPSTVQVGATAEGNQTLTLLGVEMRSDYVSAAVPPAFAALRDSALAYQQQLQAAQDQIEILQREETMLVAAISAAKSDPDDLDDNANLFRTRATSIRALIRQATARRERLAPLAERWQQQLGDYQGARTAPSGQLAITLGAEARAVVTLTLSFVTYDAGWNPVYDLRATSGGGPVQLTYKAAVHQSTGADWRNVQLTLSGGAPVVASGAALPELQTAYARILEPEPRPSRRTLKDQAAYETTDTEPSSSGENYGAASPAPGVTSAAAPPPVTAGRDGAAVRFELATAFSVPADGRPHTVEVQQAALPATYGVTVVPKLDPTAQLTATLTGWGQYNLLAGRANTYLDGTFTGAFDLDPARSLDTLRLALGPDRNVVVRREKSREFSKRALLGGTVTDATSYIITAKNLRDRAVPLRIEEQIPVPADSRIAVTATELSGGRIDESTGRLTWRTTLLPNETRAWKLAYEVKYPKKVSVMVE